MICPRCGENNPDNFKFCGMCGANLLGTSQPAEKPAARAPTESSQSARSQSMAFSRMEPRGATSKPGTLIIDEPRPPRPAEPRATEGSVEPIAGPSLLGLNQPTPETIRETTFRGMTTYYPEERHPAWGRILLTLIFIVGLVAVGWWRYKNYGAPGHGMPSWLSAMNKTTPPSENQTPQYGAKPTAQNPNQNADQNTNQPADQNKAATAADNSPSANGAADSGSAADQSNAASDKSSDTNKSADTKSADSASAKSANKAEPDASTPAKPAKAAKAAAANADSEDSTPAAKPKPVAASSEGDGLFRKGEAYLYGRGGAESCSQAIRYLKSASDKSSSKARSTFGTMYATGHCVPRDLPTSYRWFAMALQADPNNSILEKDLSAIWNQMTPPERQLATKLKPNGE